MPRLTTRQKTSSDFEGIYLTDMGREGVVGTARLATGERSGDLIPVVARLSAPVRPALGPTQSPVKRVPRVFLGGKPEGVWR